MPPAGHGTARDSMAWCMLRCRVAAVRVLCACTPHLYKPLYPDNDYETCSLDHLLCLSKYRETLQSYATEEAARAGEQESEVGLRCPHCRRDCARLQYSVRSAHSQYHHLPKLFKNILSRDISFVNTSVIRVYFARSHQDLLVAETNLRWFQIFSKYAEQSVGVCDGCDGGERAAAAVPRGAALATPLEPARATSRPPRAPLVAPGRPAPLYSHFPPTSKIRYVDGSLVHPASNYVAFATTKGRRKEAGGGRSLSWYLFVVDAASEVWDG
ncbi:hypothetical protein RR46_08747 [Papilio xuthus]|uniref:C2H2-type domain-containing protein n=1 Tax=Papilio xuthus TaxID=66420 RepID=A0A194PQP8_PAPXU|nr:hypothetical protein RR46_08747 [Papilio xuthus]